MRSLTNVVALRELKATAAVTPVASSETFSETTGGAMLMPPVIVKATALRESEVRTPELRLLHFAPVGGDKTRRIAGGVTAPLFEMPKGRIEADFNVLNGAGNGMDHNRDFTRVEIAFKIKF